MKIGIPQSFGTKIFVFTTLIVMTVVGFITSKNSSYLRENLNRQYQSSLIDSTQLFGERIFSLFSRWDNRLGYFSQVLLQAQASERSALIKSFLDSEKGLAGLILLQIEGENQKEIGKFLADDNLDKSRNQLLMQFGKSAISIARHPVQSDIVVLMRRINISGADRAILTMLFFEINLLPFHGMQDQEINTFLLNERFSDILTGQEYSNVVNQDAFGKKAQDVMKGDFGAGYLGEFLQKGRRFFVAYYHLQGYPLILVIHQDASAIDKSILAFVLDMLRWTAFFTLTAIFFAATIIRSLTGNLKKLSDATLMIGEGKFDNAVAVRSNDEIGRLSESFNLMTRKIVGLLATEHEKARLDQEFSMAQTVQNTFFKGDIAKRRNLQIASFYLPTSKCGGDWWGHFVLGSNKELIVIGDATGHGMPAALITAIAYASINIIVEQIKAGSFSNDDPSAILKILNDLLHHTLEGKLCMSFIAIIIDVEAQRLIYSNGGHPVPILIPEDVNDDRLKQGSKKLPFRYLLQKKKSTNILGIDQNSHFYNDELRINAGDKIVIYTDGLTEAKDENDKQWGNRGFQRILIKHANEKCIYLREKIIDDVVQYNENTKQFEDDLTLVVIEFNQEKDQSA
jgi:serine phosphatase RsbU (regulator of sigma subunit)/HAMP domain-containing protein